MKAKSLSRITHRTSLIGIILWVSICLWLQSPLLLISGVIFMIALPFLAKWLGEIAHPPDTCAELDDPFRAEVLLDGQVVAELTDRVWTEMFWRDYRITPVSEEGRAIIENDDLWDTCRFTFRDPVSQVVCATAFVGGRRPFVKDGIVSLRALYFIPEPLKREG